MKKRLALLLCLLTVLAASLAQADVKATLRTKIATRSGPGTQYTDLGTYFTGGKQVTAVSKVFDKRNRIWWVQVEFLYRSEYRRAYTGHKRLTVSLGQLPEEKPLGMARLAESVVPAYGPGEQYASYARALPAGMEVTVCNHESGYIQIEYQNDAKKMKRAWVPEGVVEFTETQEDTVLTGD